MASGAANSNSQRSILQALGQAEGRDAAPASVPYSRRRGGIGGWWVAIVVALIAGLSWQLLRPVDTADRRLAPSTLAKADPVPLAPPVVDTPPPPAVARIESLPEPASNAPGAVVQAPEVPAMPAAQAPPVLRTLTTPPPVAAPQPQTRRVAKEAEPPIRPATAARPTGRSDKAAPNDASDAEVDIVAALMRRLDGEAAAAAAQPPRPAVAPTATAHAAPAHAAPPSAATCRLSRREDALACKHQTCGSHWGRTKACPASERDAAERAARARRLRESS